MSTKEISNAIKSLCEEMKAVDDYNKRSTETEDKKLKKIFEHNRDEETEHAVMIIEWLRKNLVGMDEKVKKYLNN